MGKSTKRGKQNILNTQELRLITYGRRYKSVLPQCETDSIPGRLSHVPRSEENGIYYIYIYIIMMLSLYSISYNEALNILQLSRIY